MKKTAFILSFIFCTSAYSIQCKDILNTSQNTVSLSDAWQSSVEGLNEIKTRIQGRDNVIETITALIIAKEFGWINGAPGGAKTLLSRLMFKSVLNTISEREKKIFVLQFHKLISEGKITGFQKFDAMMKTGKYEIETESSLVGDKFLFLIADEAEKSNPATLNALLSVLNERKAFLGSKVVDAALSSGVFTSNKTTGEFILGFGDDRPSGEALLDRMAYKVYMPNQQVPGQRAKLYRQLQDVNKSDIDLPLIELQPLMNKVKITSDLMSEITSILRIFDTFITSKLNKSRESARYGEIDSESFPANQFSTRSIRRAVKMLKAGLIANQLMNGVSIKNLRLELKRSDLMLLAKSATYTGPSDIVFKSFPFSEKILLVAPSGTKLEADADYSPFENKVYVKDKKGTPIIEIIKTDSSWEARVIKENFSGWTVDQNTQNNLDSLTQSILESEKIDPNIPQFAIDPQIEKLLSMGTLEAKDRAELENIKENLNQFAEALNQHFESNKENNLKDTTSSPQKLNQLSLRNLRRNLRGKTEEERLKIFYDFTVKGVQVLKSNFVELNHSIEAHITGILAKTHLYVFGLPGGAKTALAEAILKAELKTVNKLELDKFTEKTIESLSEKDESFLKILLARMKEKDLNTFDMFLLQFHKLLPEGVLTGFAKVEKQLNEGIEEIDVSTSLAGEKFLYAILDEVDKANPQTLTALLSILNEREVFSGNTLIKAALRSAVMTSNKMPSELLDSFHEDVSAGLALMDRAVNKVYVPNKISNLNALNRFLIQIENNSFQNLEGLAVNQLAPLVEKVDFAQENIPDLLEQIFNNYLTKRISIKEDSMIKNQAASQEFPDYYVPASVTASDRTYLALMEQFKARFITNQIMEGVPFEKLRTQIQMEDIKLFFEGLGYWAPQSIQSTYNNEGLLEFTSSSPILENLISSGTADERTVYHMQMMIDEAQSFTDSANEVIREFISDYRETIKKYPHLFPSLLKDPGT